jgi:hypothetical protein
MATRESDDRAFDDCLADALYDETHITPTQRARAWGRLRAAASERSILPPTDDPCGARGDCPDDAGDLTWDAPAAMTDAPPTWMERVGTRWRTLSAWINRVAVRTARLARAMPAIILVRTKTARGWLTDEGCYRRAYAYRESVDVPGGSLYCYNTQLRFAYSMFQP